MEPYELAIDMPPCTGHQVFVTKFNSLFMIYVLTFYFITYSILLVNLPSKQDYPRSNLYQMKIIQEMLESEETYDNTTTFKRSSSSDLKYILLWTRNDFAPMNYLGLKQIAFVKNNCSVVKCYVTTNRTFFGVNLTKFDAIVFLGRNLHVSDLPRVRSPHQKYIFLNLESADSFPVCDEQFEGYFNWTTTYRLDSDIPYPYILIRDSKGEIVGPKQKMQWKEDTEVVGEEFVKQIQNKTKAVAWFVSNCKAISDRQSHVNALAKALRPYGLTVDVYGKCGPLQCPRNQTQYCDNLLERDYFFYLSLENSISEDYVTEKLLRALQHNVIPIVYGGANYSRFLPPGSYINIRKHQAHKLAAMIYGLIQSPNEYSQYFWWKNHYTFHDPLEVENVCAVCEALYNKEKVRRTSIYYKFRAWWQPYYKPLCNQQLLWSKKMKKRKQNMVHLVSNIWKLTYLYSNIKTATKSQTFNEEPKYEATGTCACNQALDVIKYIISIKKFLLFICMSFTITFLLMHHTTEHDQHDQHADTDSRIQSNTVYRIMTKLKTSITQDFKYILLWTRKDYAPFYAFDEGQLTFMKYNCSVNKCYITTNRKLLGENLTKFHTIIFNGRNLNTSDLPSNRSPHQKYVYLNIESADNEPVCEEEFEGYFNWTATYRLDSDIPYPYILIRDIIGDIVGPKQKMHWKKDMKVVANEFNDRIETKTEAVAWFASNCKTRNDRLGYVKALNYALMVYELKVDVYGTCGDMQCSIFDKSHCNSLLQMDYFFYMSMENSFDEDYVTEKLLTALKNDVVPIVYGGADYSRFLPFGSYIDARNKSVIELAAMIDDLMLYPNKYKQYFRWKHYYTYHDSLEFNICSICKALHNKKMFEQTTIYEKFRHWWHPDFENRCKENYTGSVRTDTVYEQQLLAY